jgi:type I restriction-modification system DNA methylase subunit
MSLFQNSVVAKQLQNQDKSKLLLQWNLFTKHFQNLTIQDNIRNSKEEQYQGEFLIDLFVNVLGYTKNPTPNFTLTTEYKNLKDSKKADGAILINEKVKAVIELKGTNTTDLGKIEIQAFGYKNNQPDCVYVITSNFEKLRFYIDNATEYLEFNLFQLTQKEFELLYLCLAYENIANDVPKKLKEQSATEEKNITKFLYIDYSLFKRELHQNLVALNPDFDPLTLFKKSQKLLDRFLFIFFAEDRNLLPTNLIFRINKEWRQLQEMRMNISLYDRYKIYFNDLNKGAKVVLPAFSQTSSHNKEEHQIFAYNGGLFQPDAILDVIVIDDELLFTHTQKLSKYDFASEVDVNILGHIFENSLNELDEIKAQLEGIVIEKTATKRKKDGVFYTPKYITKYIVDSTVGKLCIDKKAEFKIIEEDYFTDKKRTKTTKQPLLEKLNQYRNWLLQITICDPACGSGAFLNQALDFLISEHRYIDELQAKLFGDALVLSDIEKSILENNLFGVDLNEESVEIAKLALWLRTAQPNRKLNDLNHNIQCGNSLIDDVAVAGEKAFNWQTAFPEIFDKGGFDVIIGNPPYVRLETMKDVSDSLSKMNYKTFEKRGDLYCLFVEKGFNILKLNGTISYIMPNKWIQAGYGKSLREYFLKYELNQIIDFGDLQIFEGATTYPCIFVSKKSEPKKNIMVSVLTETNKDDFFSNVLHTTKFFETNKFSGETWVITSTQDQGLTQRLKKDFKTLSNFINGEAFRGIIPGLSEAFIIDKTTKDNLIKENITAKNIISPIVRGRNMERYNIPLINECDFIILAKYGSYKYIESEYPSIYQRLILFETKLKLRGQCNGSKETTEKPFTGQHHWLELDNCPTDDYLSVFSKPKIMYQAFQVKPCFIYDEQGLFCNNSMWFIPTDNKALLGILNSKMGWWLINKFCTQIQNGCQLIWKYFGQIPIANTTDELGVMVTNTLTLNKDLQEQSQKFQRTLQRKFELAVLPKKLQDWYFLSYADFIKELGKQKIKLSLSQEAEWEDYFTTEAKKVLALKSEIDTTDKTIDKIVYELYGLSVEEIAIVENS